MATFSKHSHVAVIGAGAMGSFFGGLLAEANIPGGVTLIDVWEDHIRAINEQGIRISGVGGDRIIKILNGAATTDPTSLDAGYKADLVFVQCKAAYTKRAIEMAWPIFHEGTVFVSFQNGLGNEELIAELVGPDNVLGGLTAQGAHVEGPGHIYAHTNLTTWIGEMKGGGLSERVETICKVLTDYGLPCEPSTCIRKQIWCKLLYNLAVSPMCTLVDMSLRDIFALEGSRQMADVLIMEGYKVALAEGIDIPETEADHILEKVIASNQDNKSSMCRDVLNKKPSEIDFINGMVVKLARKHKLDVPVNEAMVFFVKALESKYM